MQVSTRLRAKALKGTITWRTTILASYLCARLTAYRNTREARGSRSVA
jgi:hypothetical protein